MYMYKYMWELHVSCYKKKIRIQHYFYFSTYKGQRKLGLCYSHSAWIIWLNGVRSITQWHTWFVFGASFENGSYTMGRWMCCRPDVAYQCSRCVRNLEFVVQVMACLSRSARSTRCKHGQAGRPGCHRSRPSWSHRASVKQVKWKARKKIYPIATEVLSPRSMVLVGHICSQASLQWKVSYYW